MWNGAEQIFSNTESADLLKFKLWLFGIWITSGSELSDLVFHTYVVLQFHIKRLYHATFTLVTEISYTHSVIHISTNWKTTQYTTVPHYLFILLRKYWNHSQNVIQHWEYIWGMYIGWYRQA